jgi:hypothetical protein
MDHNQPFAEQTVKDIGSTVTAFKVDVSDLAALGRCGEISMSSPSCSSRRRAARGPSSNC